MQDAGFLDSLADVQLRLGEALLRYGRIAPHRAVLRIGSDLYEVRCQAFATPTGLWMALEKDGEPDKSCDWFGSTLRPSISRGSSPSMECSISLLTEITLRERDAPRSDCAHRAAGADRIGSNGCGLCHRSFRRRASRVVRLLAGCTLVIVCVALAARRRRTSSLIGWRASGHFATLLAMQAEPGACAHYRIFGLLVFYVPGLSLTLAMSELAHRNLVAGSARLLRSSRLDDARRRRRVCGSV